MTALVGLVPALALFCVAVEAARYAIVNDKETR